MKATKANLIHVEIIAESDKQIKKHKFIFLKCYYNFVAFIFKTFRRIIPNDLNKETTFKRKIWILQMVYTNQIAHNWYCNCCGELVFKGYLKKDCGVVMNCPHCGSIYQVATDHDGKLYRSTIIRNEENPEAVTENTIIDNGVRYGEKICGVKYYIKD